MKVPTPHPVTMPVGQLMARLGSGQHTTFDMEQFFDALLQHTSLETILAAVANVAKVYGLADRQSGETGRGDSWSMVEVYLRELAASPVVEIVSERR